MEKVEGPNIIEACQDDGWLGTAFKNKKTWTPWFIYMKSIFGLPLSEEELPFFQRCTGRQKPLTKPVREAWAVCGRQSGKSYTSALIACFLAAFGDFQKYLPLGGQGRVMVIAVDRRQAEVIFGYIAGILSLPAFRDLIIKILASEIHLKNKIVVEVKTCDFRSIRGPQACVAICDEIAYWRCEGRNPANEILRALRPSLRAIPESLLIAISTPYSRSGPLWEMFHNRWGHDDDNKTLVWKSDAKSMNETLDQEMIDGELRDDPEGGAAEWLAEFRQDISQFLDPRIIENSVIPNRVELPKIDGVYYKAFADPSAGGADSFCLAIGHAEKSGRIVVDVLRESLNPNPQATIQEFSQVLKNYRIYEVQGDRYAPGFVSQGFRDCGLQYRPVEKSKSELYLEFAGLLNQNRVELLDNKKSLIQLRSLERKTRSGGRDSIDNFYSGGHDDLSNVIAGCAFLCAGQGCLSPEDRLKGIVTSSASWRGQFSDPFRNAEITRESLEKEMRDWLGGKDGKGVGVPDRKKPDPFKDGNENY